MLSKKAVIGKVFEIRTGKGLAYFQCTHHDETMGPLIRVLPGVYEARPANLPELVSGPHQFVTFYPVRHAEAGGELTVVRECPIPDFASQFPLMRLQSLPNQATGEAGQWWLHDGMREWKIGKLPDDLKALPERMIMSAQSLMARIDQGWTLERAAEFEAAAKRRAEAARRNQGPTVDEDENGVEHYLYFPTRDAADKASTDQSLHGFSFESRLGGDGINWLLLVKHRAVRNTDILAARDQLEALAVRFGGAYDGWQAAV
jgi:hypothetical protein